MAHFLLTFYSIHAIMKWYKKMCHNLFKHLGKEVFNMANITKRGNAFLITVSCGYAVDGKQIKQHMTYKPTAKSEKRIEKEVQH